MRRWKYFTIAWLAVAWMAAAGYAQTPRHEANAVVVQKGTSYLGIGVQDVDADRARALKLKEEGGAEITTVDPDTPAFKAGIKPGDIVLEYNGTTVQGTEQLQRMVRETPAGRTVKLLLWRNGAPLTLSATVGQRKGMWMETPEGGMSMVMPPMPALPPIPPIPAIAIPRIIAIMPSGLLGIEGEPLNQEPQFADFMGVKDGVLVKAVNRDSAAERAGIKAGDVIVKIDDTHVSTAADVTAALRTARSKRSFSVTIVRNKKEMTVPVTIDER